MSIDLTPEEPSNIVGINPAATAELEILRSKRKALYEKRCYGVHKKVVVDSEKRTVTCLTCERLIDPFDYLERWADEGDRRMQQLETMDIRLRIANAELNNLKKQLESVRGKLKRDGFSQPQVERARYETQMANTHNSPFA